MVAGRRAARRARLLSLAAILTLCFAVCAGGTAGGAGGEGEGKEGEGGSSADELEDGRYGSRREGMYKWQRNKDKVKSKALEAKARRLGVSIEEVRAMEEEATMAQDPRNEEGGGGGKIESDYGKRDGQYAWQRDKEEVKRKAAEAKAKAERRSASAGASDAAGQPPGPSELDLEGAVSVPVVRPSPRPCRACR